MGLLLALLGGTVQSGPLGAASAHPGHPADDAETSAAQTLAAAYGIDSWSRIDRVDFTFHVQRPDGQTVERAWSWEPERDGGTVTFARGTAEEHRFEAVPFADRGEAHRQIKRNFINDSYWLVFPFQLVWSDPTLRDAGPAPLPLAGTPAHQFLIASWPAEGGFTPGDEYDLFLGPDGRIAEWVFRRGGGENGRPVAWGREVQAAGVTFATEFRGPQESGFVLSFPLLRVWADGAAEPITLRGE